jgi:hypothetical protein
LKLRKCLPTQDGRGTIGVQYFVRVSDTLQRETVSYISDLHSLVLPLKINMNPLNIQYYRAFLSLTICENKVITRYINLSKIHYQKEAALR